MDAISTMNPGRSVYPDLAGKVAVVTGASRGIGAATAGALAANGSAVAMIARGQRELAVAADQIRALGGQALPVQADVTDRAELARAAQTIRERLGPADILVAFAGGQGAPVPTVEETGAHWREVIDLNLTATFLTVSAFLPSMTERGRGSIITMSSSAARQALRSSAAYAAAKGGIIVFTRHLAKEIARDGIRVNALAPATTENEHMRAAMGQRQLEDLAEAFPLGRLGQPDDIARAALFLASEASSWITGITLDVAGGQIML